MYRREMERRDGEIIYIEASELASGISELCFSKKIQTFSHCTMLFIRAVVVHFSCKRTQPRYGISKKNW